MHSSLCGPPPGDDARTVGSLALESASIGSSVAASGDGDGGEDARASIISVSGSCAESTGGRASLRSAETCTVRTVHSASSHAPPCHPASRPSCPSRGSAASGESAPPGSASGGTPADRAVPALSSEEEERYFGSVGLPPVAPPAHEGCTAGAARDPCPAPACEESSVGAASRAERRPHHHHATAAPPRPLAGEAEAEDSLSMCGSAPGCEQSCDDASTVSSAVSSTLSTSTTERMRERWRQRRHKQRRQHQEARVFMRDMPRGWELAFRAMDLRACAALPPTGHAPHALPLVARCCCARAPAQGEAAVATANGRCGRVT